MSPTTQELTISKMIEEEIQKGDDIFYCTRVQDAWNVGTMTRDDFTPFAETECFDEILYQVRTLELSLIEKSKKEERERIVGILDGMKEGGGNLNYVNRTLKEAISRINNQ